MKLLDELKRQLEVVGPLRKAWFTTFNISFDLIETWILPTLAGCDIPKNAAGYEAVQSRLFGSKEGTGSVDVRVFCDVRTLRSSARKRTTMPVHGIDFRHAGLDSEKEKKFAKGLFHPKVIYLEGKNGAVIGAGSANLSIDAWSRNRECFHFERLRDAANIEEVQCFFQRLHEWAGLKDVVGLDVAGRSTEKVDWSFVSSLSKTSFLDQLLRNDMSGQNLTVWSPYFSEDLPGLVAAMQDPSRPFGKIRFVPDIKDWSSDRGGKMRISAASVKVLLERGHEFWLDMPFLKAAPDTPRLSHAKVWHTPKRIGIGSWNMSHAALNLGEKFNVEAGFVLERPTEISSLELVKDPYNFAMNDVELKEENAALEALELPEVAIRVAYDWKDCSWSWSCVLEQNLSNVRLLLPGIAAIDLSSRLTESGMTEAKPLKERFVTVEFLRAGVPGSQVVWVEERNAQERPSAGFESLDSLMAGLLQSRPDKSLEGDRFVLSGEDLESDEDLVEEAQHTRARISYFRMFAAMRQARLRFRGDEVKDPYVLRRRIRVEPGCLKELHEKILLHCGRTEAQAPAGMSRTARWFWFNELQLIHETVLKVASGQASLEADVRMMHDEVSALASQIRPDAKLLAIIQKAIEAQK